MSDERNRDQQHDEQIHEMFQAARRVDEKTAPEFGAVRGRRRVAAAAGGHGFGWAAAATLGALMLAGALWALRTEPFPEAGVRSAERVAAPAAGSEAVVGAQAELVAPPVASPAASETAPPVTSPVAPPASPGIVPAVPSSAEAPKASPVTPALASDTPPPVPSSVEAPKASPVASPAPPSPPPPPAEWKSKSTSKRQRSTEPAVPAQRATPNPTHAGGLNVVVVDSQGQPLPGATVTISNEAGFVKTTAELTGGAGDVDFPVLRPGGGYAVEVAFPGFAVQRYAGLQVQGNKNLPLTVQMIEEFEERVEIIADREVIDLDRSETTTKFTGNFVQDLAARGRFYQNAPTINPNSIEEMQVITASAGVTYGRAQGGFTQVLAPTVDGLEGVASDPAFNTESYDAIEENDFRAVADHPLSTFSIDVDTASYANVRRFLRQGRLPPRDAVRIEEMINYFRYDYPQPTGEHPFSTTVEVADCPWNADHRLARIGLKGREVARSAGGGSNLVFLIDVSGSMQMPDKLPLLRDALSLLVGELNGADRVAIVVYAGASGLVLPSTPGSDSGTILDALDALQAGGGTNGGAGLRLAYKVARENFIAGGVNRVILATDGDFNLGVTGHGELMKLIRKDADEGIFLTTLGFGTGNYKDDRLEQLADKGNGNHAYIDSLREARKVLVEQIGGTLVTIAKDVKIQVEFNPEVVGAYRLIGYENRMLSKEDFNDDKKDAGEIGSGHTVTALYELVPPDAELSHTRVDELRYQTGGRPTEFSGSGEVFTVKLRYKEPDGSRSRLIEVPTTDAGLSLEVASDDFRFAAAVAGFGMLLRDSAHAPDDLPQRVHDLGSAGLGPDTGGYRAEFLDLVELAGRLR